MSEIDNRGPSPLFAMYHSLVMKAHAEQEALRAMAINAIMVAHLADNFASENMPKIMQPNEIIEARG